MKRIFIVFLTASFILSLMVGCARKSVSDPKAITIAYQPSVGYAPLLVMKEQKLIEKHYNGEITVNWTKLSSGSAITEGMISGNIDVGSMGVPVAVTGIQAGAPFRIAFGLSAQPYAIQTNSADIHSLRDIKDTDQIAIMNLNSQPHILLAMAAKAEFGDARALDKNLTILGNADGYSALMSGAVSCHMVISPFNFMEVSSGNIHEIRVSQDIWPAENTALVTVVTESLKNEDPEIYNALLAAVEEAMNYIKDNPTSTAEMLAVGYDATPKEIETWITDVRSSYSMELHGVMNMIDFMVEEGFLDKGPETLNDLIFDHVKGD